MLPSCETDTAIGHVRYPWPISLIDFPLSSIKYNFLLKLESRIATKLPFIVKSIESMMSSNQKCLTNEWSTLSISMNLSRMTAISLVSLLTAKAEENDPSSTVISNARLYWYGDTSTLQGLPVRGWPFTVIVTLCGPTISDVKLTV